MTIVGSAYVEIRALDDKLESDIQAALSKIKQPTIDVRATVDLSKVRTDIEKLRKEIAADPLKFKAEVDTKKAVDAVEQIYETYENNPLEIDTNANVTDLETALTSVRERYRTFNSDVVADAHTANAEAQMAFLARDRRSRILPDIDKAAMAGLQGVFNAITGTISAEKIANVFSVIGRDFEALTLKGTALAAVLGTVSSAALTAAGNLLTLGSDVTRIIGLVAAAPAAFAMLAAGVAAVTIGFHGFFEAIVGKKKDEALAKLPLEAQKAALALRGVGTEIAKPVQKAFWVEMGDSLQVTIKELVPTLQAGLQGSARGMAQMFTGVLTSVRELNGSGGLKTIFDNVNTGIANMAKGAKPFTDAMGILTLAGSRWMPLFGDSIARTAERFKNFIAEAERTGRIDQWIATATSSFQQLWSSVKSVHSIFSGLTQIAAAAGSSGLRDMAAGLQHIADIVNGEPFRSRMITVMEGARAGLDLFSDGFQKLRTIIGNSSKTLGAFLQLSGDTLGKIVHSFSAMFDGTGFGDGTMKALFGLRDAAVILEPAFRSIGTALGDIGEIAEPLIRALAEGLVHLAETVQGVVGGLKDGFIAVIPIFNTFIQNVLAFVSGPIVAFANWVGDILEGFAQLPGVFQNVIMALGLALLILPKLLKAFGGLRDGIANAFNGATDSSRRFTQGLADRINGGAIPTMREFRDNTRATLSAIGGFWRETGNQIGNAALQTAIATTKSFITAFDTLKSGVRALGSDIAAGMRGIGSAVSTGAVKAFGAVKNAMLVLVDDVQAGARAIGDGAVRAFQNVKSAVQNIAGAIADKLAPIGNVLSTFGARVRDGLANGFRQVGAAIAESFRDIVEGWRNDSAKMARRMQYLRNYWTEQLASMRLATATTFAAMGSVISHHIGNMVDAIGRGIKAIPSVLSGLVEHARQTFSVLGAYARAGFESAAQAIRPILNPIRYALSDMWDSALKSMVPFTSGFRAALSQLNDGLIYTRVRLAQMGDAMKAAGEGLKTAWASGIISTRIFGDMVGQSIQRMADNTAQRFRAVGDGIGKAWNATAGYVTARTEAMRTGIASAVGNIASHFTPVVNALKNVGATASATASLTAQGLGSIAKEGGKLAAFGAVKALDGLMNALGGPWGIVLAGATVAMTLYAQSLAESKQRTEEFAQSLDQATGNVTNATKKLVAKNAFDGITNEWDDFVRGAVLGSKSVEESLKLVGKSQEEVVDKITNPKTRGEYIKGWTDIYEATKRGKQPTEEMAKAVGLTTEELGRLSKLDISHMQEKFSNVAKEVENAEKKVRQIAEATGTTTVKATILSKNFDTLASSTSSAADKFTALKQNLDLLNRSELKPSIANSQKNYQQTLADTAEAIKKIKEENQVALPTLFDVAKGFDFTSKAGRELHTELEKNSDAILKVGTETLQKALEDGKSLGDAQQVALNAMQPGIASLRKSLQDLGFAPQQIDAIVKSFGLVPEDLTTAINIEGDKEAKIRIAQVALAAQAFSAGNYEAVLAALPDSAQQAIADATGTAEEFRKGDWTAILNALDKTEGGKLKALTNILSVTNGDYSAVLKATDATAMGNQNAYNAIKRITGMDYSAYITSRHNNVNDPEIERALNWLARHRTVTIDTVYVGGQEMPKGYVVKNGQVGVGDNGGIVGSGMDFKTSLPLRFFANGGFFENHVAQIARPGVVPRVWAEAETGGEAYIPLGVAKRMRSTKILQQVADMFGFQLFRKFANGGVMSSQMMRSNLAQYRTASAPTKTVVTSSAPSMPGVNFNVYPSAPLNEEQVGRSAMETLFWQIQNMPKG